MTRALTFLFPLGALGALPAGAQVDAEDPPQQVEPAEDRSSSVTPSEATLGLSEAAFDRRLRRLRSVGWTLFGLASSFVPAAIGVDVLVIETRDSRYMGRAIAYGMSSFALLVTAGALLWRARVMTGRRRRFRRSLDSSMPTLTFDLGFGRATIRVAF